jgi:hypothetical protein
LRRGCRCRCVTAANVRFRHRACVSRLPRGCAPVYGRRGPFVNAPIENFGDCADTTAEPSRPTGPRRCTARGQAPVGTHRGHGYRPSPIWSASGGSREPLIRDTCTRSGYP